MTALAYHIRDESHALLRKYASVLDIHIIHFTLAFIILFTLIVVHVYSYICILLYKLFAIDEVCKYIFNLKSRVILHNIRGFGL